MGKKTKEHNKKVAARRQTLGNPITRKAVTFAAHGGVVRELQQASTEEQIETLNSTVAPTKPNKLRDALMKNAPKEIDKAIRQFRKEGKPVTMESLTEEARNTPSFVAMCQRVGLEMSWFEQLAKERMEINNI